MKRFLYFLVAITIVLSSCSNKKYGHYRYSKKQKTKIVKINKHTKKRVVTIPLKKKIPVANLADGKVVINKNISVNLPKKDKTEDTKPIINKDKLDRHNKLNKQKLHPSKPTNTIEEAEPNSKATTAFILAFAALFFTLLGFIIPLIGILGIILGIIAFIFSVIALKQINKNSKMYNNKNMAIFALIIGSLYLLALIIGIIAVAIVLLIFLSL